LDLIDMPVQSTGSLDSTLLRENNVISNPEVTLQPSDISLEPWDLVVKRPHVPANSLEKSLLDEYNVALKPENHSKAKAVVPWELSVCGVCNNYLGTDQTCDCGSDGSADIITIPIPVGMEVLITRITSSEPLTYSGYLANRALGEKYPRPIKFPARLVGGVDGYDITPPLPPLTELPSVAFKQS
jgi:hypothetical protein